jgi:type IV pilus assembly protein PilA
MRPSRTDPAGDRIEKSARGFTLIELIVVILVLGILSAIAIARFVSLKERAYEATMKADLRNFAIYEQNYLMDSQGTYFAGNGVAEGFVSTPGVTITATIDPGPPPSWHAIATHNKTAITCSIVTDGPSIWNIDCP